MYVTYLLTLPGEEGATYYKRDLPVILVVPGRNPKVDTPLTFIGSIGDIKNMSQQDVEDLLEVYQARDPDTVMETQQMQENRVKYMYYFFHSYLPLSLSYNGYSFWSCRNGGEPARGLCSVNGQFAVNLDKDKMDDTNWSLDFLGSYMYLYWAPDDAG